LPVKALLLDMEIIELTEYEASITAYKVRILALKVNDLEIQQAKAEAKKGGKR